MKYSSEALFVSTGVVITGLLGVCDGGSGVRAGIAAWLICAAVILVDRVANCVLVRKTSANQNRMAFLIGVIPRLLWTLSAAGALSLYAKERLSVGFWPAILVYYQVALLVVAMRAKQHIS